MSRLSLRQRRTSMIGETLVSRNWADSQESAFTLAEAT
jgi:hypothetical protein